MPEVVSITMPTVERYASKIGAQISIISERKHEGVSVTYEKTQVFELGRGNDWNILIDADVAISRYLPDVTKIVPPDYVGVHMSYKASKFFPCDAYFTRDARDIAISSDFMLASRMCHDVWTPLEGDPASYKIGRDFILDEYCFSRNLARYGLKFAGSIPEEAMIFHLNHGSDGERTLDELRAYAKSCC